MGNNHSRSSEHSQFSQTLGSHKQQQQQQQPAAFPPSTAPVHSSTTAHNPPPATVRVTPQSPGLAAQPSRVLVDIRGANLDSNNYAVWVEKRPRRQRAQQAAEAMEGGVMMMSSTLQAVGGVLVTILTIQKLLEELKLLRGLRRSSNVSAGSTATRSSTSKTPNPAGSSNDTAFALPKHLAEQLTRSSLKKQSEDLDSGKPAAADSSNSSSRKQQSAWSSIAGLQHVKMLLQEVTVLPLVRPDLFTGVRSPPSAVLLYGPPGTGKTLLAKAVAAASGASFFPITGSSVLSKWYGESEQNVRRLFEEAAAAAPAVIFIDEVDSLLAKRGGAGADGPGGAGEASRRVTNEFLAFIDGIATNTRPHSSSSSAEQASMAAGRVVVIAATNAPWDLDEAALSRFSARLLVPLPDAAARQVILQESMQGVSHQLTEDCFKQVAEQADGYSGRDLIAVCREASMRPMRELWGGRILEGEAPRHCQQQQQLIAAVTAVLQQGGSSKKLRRSLERWKRQAGAGWCDVDRVLHAGQQAAKQQQQQQEQEQKQDVLQLQQQLQCNDVQEQQVSAVGLAEPGGHQQDHADQQGQQLQQQDQHPQQLEGAAGDVLTNSSSDSLCSTATSNSQIQQQLQHSDPAGACSIVSRSHFTTVNAADALHDNPVSDQDGAHSNVNQQATAALAGNSSSRDSAMCTSNHSNSSSKPSSWTLEDLIALPADVVRPVEVADLHWALKQVGQVESLTDKFEEWTRKFGSGDGMHRTGRDAWRYLPMYM